MPSMWTIFTGLINNYMMTHALYSVRASRHLQREEGDAAHEQSRAQEGSIILDVGRPDIGTHVTVFKEAAVEQLALRAGEVVLDATAGEGGHSEAILKAAPVRLIALDADERAVAHTRVRLAHFGDRATVVQSNFANAAGVLEGLGIAGVNKALFDLGWNRGQLKSGRGFSFLQDEPLSMSYGPTPASEFNAAEVLNSWSEETIANALFGYGEERYARRIAKHIVAARAHSPFETTAQLVAVIAEAVPAIYRRGRIHFATRTFQALRIAVNDELGVLERGLRGVWKKLLPGGRIAVITFHSIEDRLVKQLFVAFEKEGGRRVTKKPLIPGDDELRTNPSARSAKLRVIEKLTD